MAAAVGCVYNWRGAHSVDEKQIRKHFEEFFEDVFSEMMNFGEIQEMCVAGNIGDHLIGNTCAYFAMHFFCTRSSSDRACFCRRHSVPPGGGC